LINEPVTPILAGLRAAVRLSEPGSLDVLTMGRVGVDIYPQSAGPLEDVSGFSRFLGGTATNVAVAAARLGRHAAVITKVGNDPFGRYVRRALDGFGVESRFVGTAAGLPTPVVFAELNPPSNPQIWFYRAPKAPDMTIESGELDRDAITAARIFWVTGTGLSDEPSAGATFESLSWRSATSMTVLDLDWRPALWPDLSAARGRYRRAIALSSVVLGNRAEVQAAVGTDDHNAAADRLLAAGVKLVVVKLGSEGVLVAHTGGRELVTPLRVEVVNGLGAGDAFGGALCHRLLAGDTAADAVRFASAAGAYVVGRLACADAMPTEAEVAEMME
jgi:5-dehydro-2-deoxygluconokinase